MAAFGDDEMDDVFKALADPSRRMLLDSLNAHNGQTLRQLCAGLDMARQSVSKHLAVLEAAGLVTTVRRGREKLHYLNAAPISDIAERWISRYDQPRVEALADLKKALEETEVEAPSFVYTTYIRTTPERLWQALTDPAFSRRYLGHALESDWQAGSAYVWDQDGLKIAHPDQVILESEPYRRLSFTFHTFIPELTAVTGISQDILTKVTFDIEPHGEQVKLTVVHDGFEPGSIVLELISGGWPVKLSDLKTMLERSPDGSEQPAGTPVTV